MAKKNMLPLNNNPLAKLDRKLSISMDMLSVPLNIMGYQPLALTTVPANVSAIPKQSSRGNGLNSTITIL